MAVARHASQLAQWKVVRKQLEDKAARLARDATVEAVLAEFPELAAVKVHVRQVPPKLPAALHSYQPRGDRGCPAASQRLATPRRPVWQRVPSRRPGRSAALCATFTAE